MKQQTAVEWLIDKHFGGIDNVTPDFKYHIEQAKQMEKEQIKAAWIATDNQLQRMAAENYYNKTYNQ